MAAQSTIVRWLWIWITIGILVVVVVIGFLLGIVRALGSIDDNLLEASSSVKAVDVSANPLPASLQTINGGLGDIDNTLKPIPGQAQTIAGGLGKIRDSLRTVDGSLKDTAGALVTTNGSLNDTSGVLVSAAGTAGDIDHSLVDTTNVLKDVLDTAGKINSQLKDAQRKDSDGTELIPVNVRKVNGVLDDAQDDTHNIVGQLRGVNQNLRSICNSPLLALLPPAGLC